jgi:GNAT superfamily N-acetyltransferase
VLIEAPDGTLAATAIVWLDESTRTGEFEPVGTHRDFRRQGLGRALQLYGMHLARAAGADGSRLLPAAGTACWSPVPARRRARPPGTCTTASASAS